MRAPCPWVHMLVEGKLTSGCLPGVAMASTGQVAVLVIYPFVRQESP